MPPNKPSSLTSQQQAHLDALFRDVTDKLDELLANSNVMTAASRQQQHNQPTPSPFPNQPNQPGGGPQQPQQQHGGGPQHPQPYPGGGPPQQGRPQPGPLTGKPTAAASPFTSGFFSNLSAAIAKVFQGNKEAKKAAVHEARAEYHQVKAETAALPQLFKMQQAKVYHAENRLAAAQQTGKGIPKAFANVEKASAALEKTRAKIALAPMRLEGARDKLTEAEGGQTGRSVFDKLGGAWGNFKDIFKNTDGAKNMQSLFKGVGQLSGVFGKTGKLFSSVTAFGEQIFKSVENLQRMNQQMHDFDTQFAPFSGGMAAVMAEQRVRDIQLAQERGERRAPTARLREESAHELNVRMAKITDVMDAFKNIVQTGLNKVVTGLLDLSGLPKAFEALNKWLNQLSEKENVKEANKNLEGWVNEFGGNWGLPN